VICRYVKKNVSVVARLCSDDQSIFDTSILGGENDYIIYIYMYIYIYNLLIMTETDDTKT